jgi:hypothetical protein
MTSFSPELLESDTPAQVPGADMPVRTINLGSATAKAKVTHVFETAYQFNGFWDNVSAEIHKPKIVGNNAEPVK